MKRVPPCVSLVTFVCLPSRCGPFSPPSSFLVPSSLPPLLRPPPLVPSILLPPSSSPPPSPGLGLSSPSNLVNERGNYASSSVLSFPAVFNGEPDVLLKMCNNEYKKPDMNKFNALIKAGAPIRTTVRTKDVGVIGVT